MLTENWCRRMFRAVKDIGCSPHLEYLAVRTRSRSSPAPWDYLTAMRYHLSSLVMKAKNISPSTRMDNISPRQTSAIDVAALSYAHITFSQRLWMKATWKLLLNPSTENAQDLQKLDLISQNIGMVKEQAQERARKDLGRREIWRLSVTVLPTTQIKDTRTTKNIWLWRRGSWKNGYEKMSCQWSTFAMSTKNLIKVVEAMRGIEAIALALNDPRGLDEEMSGICTFS